MQRQAAMDDDARANLRRPLLGQLAPSTPCKQNGIRADVTSSSSSLSTGEAQNGRHSEFTGNEDATVETGTESPSARECLLSYDGENTRKVDAEYIGEEVKKQLSIAGPMVLVNLLQFMILVVSIIFVGHLGELELASASLANSLASVLGLYVMLGMASALETLCGQAYGAEQYRMLGVYFQRALVVLYATCVPLTFIFLYMEKVLRLLGQTAEISAKAGEYAVWLIPTLYASAFLQPLVKFLQTQSIVMPMVISSAVTLGSHVGLCWLFMYELGLGYTGAAMATSISYWVNVVLLIIFVQVTKVCEKTWSGGFSKEAFTDLSTFFRLAVASASMICLEYWSFEIMIMIAGLLAHPKLQLSALSICLSTVTMNYMIPLGLSAAASTRVSNELGSGRPDAARIAVYVVLAMSLLQATLVFSLLISVRNIWGWVFSNDLEVVEYVATIMPFIACLSLFDGIQGVLSGVARGVGWQALGAFVNLATFYGCGIPVGVVLAFVYHWNGKGIFTGLICGLGVQMFTLAIITYNTKWKQKAEAVHAHLPKGMLHGGMVHGEGTKTLRKESEV